MCYFVYVLFNYYSQRFYIGLTSDLPRRLEEHKKAKLSHRNKSFQPIFVEKFWNKEDAQRREKYLKDSKERYTLKAMLKETIKNS